MKANKGYPLVIVVDDEEYILEFMKSDLEVNGLEVVSFANATDAQNYLTSINKCDVGRIFLITDYRMPELSGLDMIENLKKESIEVTKSLLITGLIPKDDLERASQMDGVEVMEKPVDLDRIISMIKSSVVSESQNQEKQEELL